jgi:uncharacterized membrane protein
VIVRALDLLAALAVAGVIAVVATGGARPAGILLDRPEAFVVAAALFAGARALVRPYRVRVRVNPWIAAGAYVAAMGFIVVTRHRALRTHALDLGQYVQTVWSIANGHGATFTLIPDYFTTVRMHAWGDHFQPILYALVPLVWATPSVPPILLAQAVALGLGAVAVFHLVLRRASATGIAHGAAVAGAFAVVYLLNPSLHGINLRDIHPAAFAIPLVLAAAAAHDARRFGGCALAVVAAAACREDAAVAVVGFALWLALARGRVLVGALVALAAVALLTFDLQVLMPYFRGDGVGYHHLYRYTHLGESLGEILVSVVARPWRWLSVLFTGPKLVYALAMLAPLGFLPLLAPRALAAAAPGLAMNVLSLDPILINPRSQYQAFVLPFLVLAAVDGYFVLRARLEGRRLPGIALGAAVCFALVLTSRTFNDFSVRFWRLGPAEHAAHALMRRIPPDTGVSANERLVPHLVMRKDVFVYPRGLGIATHVIERESELARRPAEGYAEVARAGPFVLLERAAR